MKVTFMVGEMARLHNISRQTLIHYDRIGLFSPGETDEKTGYRYYSLEQCEDLHVILSLKQMGMKLSEVKAYLEKETVEERIGILEGKEAMILEKIREINRARKQLEAIIASLKTRKEMVPFEMGVRFEEVRHVIVEDVAPPRDLYELELAIKRIMEKTVTLKVEKPVELFFIVDDSSGEDLFPQVAFEVEWKTGDRIEAGEYGYIYHKGSYETICESRKKLTAFLESSGYGVAGNSVERALLDSLAVASESEYLVEILLPVEKRA